MHSTALQETVEGVSACVCEGWAEAVTPDVFHLVLVWQRGNSTLWILLAEFFVEKDEIGEASTDFDERLLE